MVESQKIKAVSLPHPNKLLIVEPLDYPNPYNYMKSHRHDYFEIILVNEGEGKQLIDFSSYKIEPKKIYTVYPGQVHLMQRQTANGLLIQFRKDIFEYIFPIKHYHLYHTEAPEFDKSTFDHLYALTNFMRQLLLDENLSSFNIHKAYNYLQIILITIVESKRTDINFSDQDLIKEFLSLLSEHIYSKKKVNEYCELLNCSSEKLNSTCKSTLGKKTLHLIHEEVLLEIKRLLLMGKLSLKEIAYELNFDSQANFSAFIKLKTQLTPSELQRAVQRQIN